MDAAKENTECVCTNHRLIRLYSLSYSASVSQACCQSNIQRHYVNTIDSCAVYYKQRYNSTFRESVNQHKLGEPISLAELRSPNSKTLKAVKRANLGPP